MDDKETVGGVYYEVEVEKLRRYYKATPEEKLKWLEEINRLVEQNLTKESQTVRELFREGII